MQISHSLTVVLATVILLAGCKKDDVPAPSGGGPGAGPAALTASTAPTVQMTINGTTASYTEGSAYGSFTHQSEEVATPPVLSTKHYGFAIYQLPEPDDMVFAVDQGTFQYQGTYLTNAKFFSFFPTGPVIFGDTENNNGLVAITWWDASGQEWSTHWGTDQTGSSFNITERLELPSAGVSSILVRATFTCKLYLDGGTGQFKQVTNGTGVFRYENL